MSDMRLEVIYQCLSCGAVSVDGRAVTGGGTGFDLSPICACDEPDVVTFMELHTRVIPPEEPRPLPLHRTEAGYPNCSTCDGGGCFDCTDQA